MKDYQAIMAVPVSDTTHRPKDGETVIALLPDGLPAATWLSTTEEEPVQPTHWLRVIPCEMSFIKWPDGCTMSDDDKQRLADALADGPSGHIIVLDEAPSYPHLRAAIKRRVWNYCKKGRALDIRNIIRQFDGADLVSAVPDVDLPRLFELLDDYEIYGIDESTGTN